MTSASLDRTLAWLLLGVGGTGLLTLRAGAADTASLFVVHGLLGGALLAALVVKLGRSVRPALRARRWRRLSLSLVIAGLILSSIGGGFLWVASGQMLTVGSWTVLTLHVLLGLGIVPLIVVHLLPRRWRVLAAPPTAGRPTSRRSGGDLIDRPSARITRRTLLWAGAIGLASASFVGLAALAERLRGGERRFTGSRWLPAGGIPPATTFYGEPAPAIAPDAWRLRVRGDVEQPLELDLAALEALGVREQGAVLDCTSGWAIETTWRGVPMERVIAAAGPRPGARSALVLSATGWATALPLGDVGATILSTGVAGEPLPSANGGPCRLVVPGRRGLDWVKWVVAVELS